MVLSIIMPAYNEAKTIGRVLSMIQQLKLDFDREVIVVDDGSTDLTEEVVKNSGCPVVYLRHEANRGKGSAIRTGIEQAKGDFILIQDADCEYSPGDYPELLGPLLSKEAEVVYGSRILNKGNGRSSFSFYWGGRLLSWWTNLLYGSRITDEATCYKVFKSSILKSIKFNCKGFEFCPEVTAKLLKRGIKITEVPISYSPRTVAEGKKISWKDGMIALWVLLKLRFVNC